jgi:catechol 2,3-dioxygenase-like lactoylglutathione lyase family enzyme
MAQFDAQSGRIAGSTGTDSGIDREPGRRLDWAVAAQPSSWRIASVCLAERSSSVAIFDDGDNMRLNHLDLHVPDVAATRDFFRDHLGFTEIETRGTNGLAILHDDAGLELVISRPIEKLGGGDTPTAGVNTYHIGFMQPSRAQVDDLFERLRAAGAEIWTEPQAMRGGWLFYCFAPGRILIEIGWRPTD